MVKCLACEELELLYVAAFQDVDTRWLRQGDLINLKGELSNEMIQLCITQ